MPRFIEEENDPVRYSVGIDREGLCHDLPGVTFRTFKEADELARQLYRAFYREEPQLTTQHGEYMKFGADCRDDTPAFYVWNHTDSTSVRPEHIRQTDPDAEAILSRYYEKYQSTAKKPHDDLIELV